MADQAGREQQTHRGSLRAGSNAAAARRRAGPKHCGSWEQSTKPYARSGRHPHRGTGRARPPPVKAANRSHLWLGIAAVIAVLGGRRGRRAALEGVVAIGVTSATVNLGLKPLANRQRPHRHDPDLPTARTVPMPKSSSFPSGHAASAFAFTYAVGRQLPGLAVPIGLLAGGVAYSRVHTGVHYPGDVIVGSILGGGTATMVVAAGDRLLDPSKRQS